jgi:hypothetical protein
MSIKVTIALAAAIVLSSAVVASAQAPYYDYDPGFVGGGAYRNLAAPPSILNYPAAAGGGSIGYNENLRHDDW